MPVPQLESQLPSKKHSILTHPQCEVQPRRSDVSFLLFLTMHNNRRTATSFAVPQTSGQGVPSPPFTAGPALPGFVPYLDLTSTCLLSADLRPGLLLLPETFRTRPRGPISRPETATGPDSQPCPGAWSSLFTLAPGMPGPSGSGVLFALSSLYFVHSVRVLVAG